MKMKKALAFLTGLMMAMPPAAVSAFAAEDSSTAEPPAAAAPVPHLFAAPANLPIDEEIQKLQEQIQGDIPSRFDLRELGLVSPVKDQRDLGTCWAHATLGSIETERMAEDPHIDLSERYLATYIKSEEFGDGTNNLNSGSNACTAMGLLSNWIGVVPESLAPYEQEYISDSTREEMQQESALHVTGIHDLKIVHMDDDPELFEANQKIIKQAICSGHALYFSMNFNSINSSTCAIYNEPTGGTEFEYDSPHAIVVVGYDDHYSADNFLTPPPADGAWLIKNSWNVTDGNGGYYWVSYCDPSINAIHYFDVTSAEEHDHLYSYDDYGANGEFAIGEDGDECVYISNIYTAKADSFVTDVMLNINNLDDEYEITVYTDLADPAVPTSGTAHAATVGRAAHTGYLTVTLDEPVHINADEPFAVVTKLSGVRGYHIACEYARFEYDDYASSSQYSNGELTASGDLIDEAHIMKTFGANQSFFSADGCTWTDLYDSYKYDEAFLTGNICLRAMTVDEGKVKFSSYSDALAPGTELALSTADGSSIYYAINGGEFSLYSSPITFTEDMTISAYAEGNEDTVYTRHYAEKYAELSSLLVQSNYESYSAYADLTGESVLTVPASADTLLLYPMTTGRVTDGKTVTGSYEPREIECGIKPFTFTLTAEEDGLKPTTYEFRIQKDSPQELISGTWINPNRYGWFQFNEDGTGTYTDRKDGTETAVSYAIKDGNEFTLTVGKTTHRGWIAGSADSFTIQWEDGTTENLYYDECVDAYFTDLELIDMATAYITAWTGKAPKSVKTEVAPHNDAEVIISITAADGKEYLFDISAITAIGSDQDGNVIVLTDMQEQNDIHEIKSGFWCLLPQSQDDNYVTYYYFNADSHVFLEYSCYSDQPNQGTYRQENNQLILDCGMYIDHMAMKNYEDAFEITWAHGRKATMYYMNDTAPEDFSFLTNDELQQLISDYYEAACLRPLRFCSIFSADGEKAEINAYDFLNGQQFTYYINRFTGLGEDQNGNKIDLYNPVTAKAEYFTKGLWTNVNSFYMGDRLIEYVDNLFWLGDQSDDRAMRYDSFEGKVYPDIMTYRLSNGNGVFCYDNGNKEYFTYTEIEDGYLLRISDAEGNNIQESRIVLIKQVEQKDVKFYSVVELADMAKQDYSKKHNTTEVDISTAAMQPDGSVLVYLCNPVTGVIFDIYTVDPFTGIGTSENSDAVNLPRTGITSPGTLMLTAAAFLMTGFGFCAVQHSGILRRKEEQTEEI